MQLVGAQHERSVLELEVAAMREALAVAASERDALAATLAESRTAQRVADADSAEGLKQLEELDHELVGLRGRLGQLTDDLAAATTAAVAAEREAMRARDAEAEAEAEAEVQRAAQAEVLRAVVEQRDRLAEEVAAAERAR